MKRRDFIQLASVLSFATLLKTTGFTPFVTASHAQSSGKPFSRQWLEELAQTLSKKPYKSPKTKLPDNYASLSYDQYRDIRFVREKAIWRDQKLPFQLQLFHTGFLYQYPIQISLVHEGQAFELKYSKDLFSFGPLVEEPDSEKKSGFSGFRIHTPINQKNYYDEFSVFQGASYFRAIAAGQVYGLSARGLSIDTGQPKGEEFPVFTKYWIEQPEKDDLDITVHALLDSKSVVGAYSFTLAPGQTTQISVKSTLYPRRELNHVGIAPLTSMFLLSPGKQNNFDDFRSRVHDTEGLSILNGKNEWIWRPLTNPRKLQFSAFIDKDPTGFGFSQRHRSFYDYQDLEARYEKRPSLWIEPVGKWGRGYIELVEIPTDKEIHDNIVAFWQPRDDLLPGNAYQYDYNLHWGWQPEPKNKLAIVATTRTGRAGSGVTQNNTNRIFIVDFRFSGIASNVYNNDLVADVSASSGRIEEVILQPNPEVGGQRLTFQYDPKGSDQADLRAVLTWKKRTVSEIWLYRWET